MRKSTEDLQTAWAETAELWQDDVSRSFCERYLEPIGPTMKISLDAVGRMQQLLNQIHREVEE
ncbi:MAG: hypothetical protein ACR2NM_00750 [Bythopirellula sp.]